MSEINIKTRLEHGNDSLLTNISKQQVLLEELFILRKEIEDLILIKIEERKEENQDRPKVIEKNILEDETQLKINLRVKSFMFVLRQFFTKYFRALYQSREILGYLKVASPLPDLSVDKGIKDKLKKLISGSYEFDKDIIARILEGSDFLILSRVFRNSIKKYAILKTFSINTDRPDIRIIFPIDGEIKDDPTLEYVQEKHIVLDETECFTIKIGFLDNCLTYIDRLEQVLVEKLNEKNFFDDYL